MSRSNYPDSLTPNAQSASSTYTIYDAGNVKVAEVDIAAGPGGPTITAWRGYISGLSAPVLTDVSVGTIVFYSSYPSYEWQIIDASFSELASGNIRITRSLFDPYYGNYTVTYSGWNFMVGRTIRIDRWEVDDLSTPLKSLPPPPGE